MELRRYAKILRDHWVVMSLAFSLTVGLTVGLVAQQPWVYESSGTYIVRPRAVATDEIVAAFNALSRGVEINSTYAAIARSEIVEERAEGVVGESSRGLSVDSDIVTGTNMIRISVRGEDPERLQPFAVAVGEETIRFVAEMEDAYVIQLLDPPSDPGAPVGPNKALTIATSAVFGLLLGAVLAFLIDYFSGVVGWRASFEALDPAIGTFNGEYFNLRMKEEIARLEDSGHVFTVGILTLREWGEEGKIPNARRMREVVSLVGDAVRAQDVVCSTEPGTLAIIFPNVPHAACQSVLDDWKVAIESRFDEKPIRVDTEVREYSSATVHELEAYSADAAGA